MKLALTAIATVTVGVIGAVLARQHWNFLLVMATMLAVVIVLGTAILAVVMTWPQRRGRADGQPAGWF